MYKAVIAIFLSGVALGAYLVHAFEHEPLVNYIAKGWCGQRDVAHTFYLFNCQDGFIAAQLNQRLVEQDQAQAQLYDADTQAILADMSKPKKKPKKGGK